MPQLPLRRRSNPSRPKKSKSTGTQEKDSLSPTWSFDLSVPARFAWMRRPADASFKKTQFQPISEFSGRMLWAVMPFSFNGVTGTPQACTTLRLWPRSASASAEFFKKSPLGGLRVPTRASLALVIGRVPAGSLEREGVHAHELLHGPLALRTVGEWRVGELLNDFMNVLTLFALVFVKRHR